ncbi:hypothetical protein FKP32DRAFT_1674690 [Trametes sanguinea]|nr:hypothetical protein FKP32DRAFT_1674690 [Trametes sanguinea]
MSSAMGAPTPTQSIGHLKHVNPTAGPTQLSKTHPNIVNYAISAGGVLLGLALIGGFALILRCNRRRRKRLLDAEIDARIHEKTLARMALSGSRTQSLAKMPHAAMSRNPSVVYPMPLLTAGRASTANSSTETLAVPRARATCIRASDQRLPCGCPDCVVVTRAALLRDGSSGGSGSGSTRLGSGVRGSLLNPHPAVRYSTAGSRFARSSSSPRKSSGHRVAVGSQRTAHSPTAGRSPYARPRTSRNDENAYRTDSPPAEPNDTRADHLRSEWATSFAVASHSGVPLGYKRGIGMGIITATTTGALGCPSPATPSLVFTPQAVGSAFGSPALSLSDDAGATSISPGTPPQVSLGSLGTLGSLSRAGGSFARSGTGSSLGTTGKVMDVGSSLDLAVSRGYLGSGSGGSLAHLQVSPHVAIGSPVQGTPASPHLSPELAYGSTSADPYAPPRTSTSNMQKIPQQDVQTDVAGGGEGKWFTEVDWFAEDGPINLSYYEQPNAVSASQASGYVDRYDNHNGITV